MRKAEMNLIAAERRRRIWGLVNQQGFVSVSGLAASMQTAENTIRRDLDLLHSEGMVIRTHGGATSKERAIASPPYSQTRDEHLQEKAWIGTTALSYLPSTGSVLINAGSTTYQLAVRLPPELKLQVSTNSPDIAAFVAANTSSEVGLLGGRIVSESLESDGLSHGVSWKCSTGIHALLE